MSDPNLKLQPQWWQEWAYRFEYNEKKPNARKFILELPHSTKVQKLILNEVYLGTEYFDELTGILISLLDELTKAHDAWRRKHYER